ncbi:hypothetical protein JFL43_13995 [Viridibacillus sp. YIM B01967]|uniref:Uncharacterized protein n=1 Tax=Viridibacillus soli TaxID=2798301 RepID=A0ABS1H958_9BACL|nr:hypothetical protein [Viridibacillus soli]MBK3495952.1 hypothetical protein [Viridibacillus soli]
MAVRDRDGDRDGGRDGGHDGGHDSDTDPGSCCSISKESPPFNGVDTITCDKLKV